MALVCRDFVHHDPAHVDYHTHYRITDPTTCPLCLMHCERDRWVYIAPDEQIARVGRTWTRVNRAGARRYQEARTRGDYHIPTHQRTLITRTTDGRLTRRDADPTEFTRRRGDLPAGLGEAEPGDRAGTVLGDPHPTLRTRRKAGDAAPVAEGDPRVLPVAPEEATKLVLPPAMLPEPIQNITEKFKDTIAHLSFTQTGRVYYTQARTLTQIGLCHEVNLDAVQAIFSASAADRKAVLISTADFRIEADGATAMRIMSRRKAHDRSIWIDVHEHNRMATSKERENWVKAQAQFWEPVLEDVRPTDNLLRVRVSIPEFIWYYKLQLPTADNNGHIGLGSIPLQRAHILGIDAKTNRLCHLNIGNVNMKTGHICFGINKFAEGAVASQEDLEAVFFGSAFNTHIQAHTDAWWYRTRAVPKEWGDRIPAKTFYHDINCTSTPEKLLTSPLVYDHSKQENIFGPPTNTIFIQANAR